jgi:hypothetical protein
VLDLLLDPDKALDAVNKAVALCQKAMNTAQSIEQLGPAVGKYFDAKANAVAAAKQAKASGSQRAKAIELELAIDAQKEFEEDLKRLFWNAGKMDTWQRIVATTARLEAEAAKEAAAAKRAAARKKKEQEELTEVVIACVIGAVLLGVLIWGGWELLMYCKSTGRGR